MPTVPVLDYSHAIVKKVDTYWCPLQYDSMDIFHTACMAELGELLHIVEQRLAHDDALKDFVLV